MPVNKVGDMDIVRISLTKVLLQVQFHKQLLVANSQSLVRSYWCLRITLHNNQVTKIWVFSLLPSQV